MSSTPVDRPATPYSPEDQHNMRVDLDRQWNRERSRWLATLDAERAESAALLRRAEQALDALEDALRQGCSTWQNSKDDPTQADSGALSAYADGMRLLVQHGRFQIDSDRGRRIIGRFVARRALGVSEGGAT